MVLGLVKLGVPWRDALAMPVGEADAWLETYAEILEGPSKKKTYVVKRDGNRGKTRR